ncbi:MAG: hypothetical protein PHS02_01625 [Candidatus ainarchaeum sp.]|nr:hypothetical protein [Candidatus ainarchaeum sp.]
MELNPDMKKRVAEEDWEYFAQMARTFELEVEKGDDDNAKLQKETQMIKKVLEAHLSTESNRRIFISASNMVKLYRTIEKLEAKVTQNNQLHGEFVNFLRALLHKMKQEKLVTYKTLEKRREFLMHKDFEDSL